MAFENLQQKQKKSTLIVIFILINLVLEESVCANGWVMTTSNTCVKLMDSIATWHDSKRHCISLGGDLVTLNGIRKDMFIRGWLIAQGTCKVLNQPVSKTCETQHIFNGDLVHFLIGPLLCVMTIMPTFHNGISVSSMYGNIYLLLTWLEN